MTTIPELISPGTGVVLVISTSLDLTTSTGLSLAIKKPVSRTEVTLPGGTIDGTDPTKFNYTVGATDFDEIGLYEIVPVAAFSGVPGLYGDVAQLNVVARFAQ